MFEQSLRLPLKRKRFFNHVTMEISKKETWFATIKVKTVPAFFSDAKYDRLFVT